MTPYSKHKLNFCFMPKNSQFTAKFKGNKHSLFPIRKNNIGTLKIGKVVPIFKDMLMPGDKISLSMGHLVRALPMQSPIMGALELNLRAFAVPLTALAFPMYKERDVQNFFNMSLNKDGSIKNPFCFDLHEVVKEGFTWSFCRSENWSDPSSVQRLRNRGVVSFIDSGGLNDYLNFPTFAGLFYKISRWLGSSPLMNVNPSSTTEFVWLTGYNQSGVESSTRANRFPFVDPDDVSYIFGKGETRDSLRGPASFLMFVLCRYLTSELQEAFYGGSYDGNSTRFAEELTKMLATNASSLGGATVNTIYSIVTGKPLVRYGQEIDYTESFDIFDYIWERYKVDAQVVFREYCEYVFTWMIGGAYFFETPGFPAPVFVQFSPAKDGDLLSVYECGYLPDLFGVLGLSPETSTGSVCYDFSYLCAYWKYIADWCINSVIDAPDGPDEFYLKQVAGVNELLHTERAREEVLPYINFEPFTQRYDNDLFTTAVADARGLDVRIPTDGTIPDLREANAQQTIIDKLRNAGTRLKDVVKALMGFNPSTSESELSIPLWSNTSFIQPQSVLQNSQPTEGNPLGQYGGIGIDSARPQHMFEYMNKFPVPCVVMVVASVSVPPSYYQGLPREFERRSIYDFYFPDYALLGEQEIRDRELYFDVQTRGRQGSSIFGFNRRYYDWTNYQSEVHADMRTSLDFWHLARKFDSAPVLSSDFIGVDVRQNNLNRVFANTSFDAMPFLYNFYFEGGVVRELPRYIEYKL